MNQMTSTGSGSDDEDEGPTSSVPMRNLVIAFVRARHLIALIVAGAFALTFFYAVFLLKPEYTAVALVAPVEADNGSSGVRSALSAVAGISMGGFSSGNFTKFTELLTSARLAESLQKKYGLMAVAFPGMWDSEKHEWRQPSGPIAKLKEVVKAMLGMAKWSPPNPSRFALFLGKSLKITRVAGSTPFDLRNQTTQISVTMDDPQEAVRFLSQVITGADDICREDQLVNSQRRVDYLTNQLKRTNEVILQQSLQQLLIGEEQTLLTLHANSHYAVDLIDLPNADNIPTGTRVASLLLEGLVGGVFLGFAIVFLLMRRRVGLGMTAGEALEMPFPDPIGALIQRLRGR